MRCVPLFVLLAACSPSSDDTGRDPDSDSDTATTEDDLDGDGFGVTEDCNDDDATVFPGAVDACDGVDNDCDGTVDGGFAVPADFATIQEAVDAASEGDTVCVAPGTYNGNLTLTTDGVRVVGNEGSEVTILDARGAGSVVTIDAASDVTLQGVTLTRGHASQGAGLWASDAEFTLRDVHATANTCGDDCEGVGVYLHLSTATFDDVSATANRFVADSTTITDRAAGVGMYVYVSEVTATELDVSDNEAIVQPDAVAQIIEGGGLYVSHASTVDIDGLRVVGNRLRSDGGQLEEIARGGGMHIGGTTDIRHAVVASNVLEAKTSYGGGIFVVEDAQFTLSNSQILANRSGDDALTLTAGGGGVYAVSWSVNDLSFVDVVGNEVVSDGACIGGGIYSGSGVDGMVLDSSLVVDNQLTCVNGQGGGVFVNSSSSSVFTAAYNLLWDNSEPTTFGMSAPQPGETNFEADPLFVSYQGTDPTAWDLRPADGSPLIDAGNPATFDVDSTRADIGAHGGPDPL